MRNGCAVNQRQHAAAAQCHADDFLSAAQGPGRFDEAGGIVVIVKLLCGEKAEFALVEHEDINEIEQGGADILAPAPD